MRVETAVENYITYARDQSAPQSGIHARMEAYLLAGIYGQTLSYSFLLFVIQLNSRNDFRADNTFSFLDHLSKCRKDRDERVCATTLC